MTRYFCQVCGEPARYYSVANRRLRGNREHDLCSRCYRSLRESLRAKPPANDNRPTVEARRPRLGRLRLLRTIAKDALAENATKVDFCGRIKAPKKPHDETEPTRLTGDELALLVSHIPEQWLALVLLMASTTMRWGEASGLKWDDIDLASGVIQIRRTNWKGSPQAPKTPKSKRRVAIAYPVGPLLEAHRRRMVKAQHPG